MESLYELWGKRNPEWEKKYQSSIIEVLSDYGKGTSQYLDVRGKTFGAGYEVFIIAFFIGLYFDKRRPLTIDKSKKKTLGQAIMYWGNIENRIGRTSYSIIREYIFAALVARTDFDFIALDKGNKTSRNAVDALMETMEQYANYGFYYMEEKLQDDPNFFFKDTAFLRIFLSFLEPQAPEPELDSDDDEPDPLE